MGIIDVRGFDFSHPDFMDGDTTRWVRIWDQGGVSRPGGPAHNGTTSFAYGSDILHEHMQAAIDAVAAELEEATGAPVPVSINISLGTNGHAHDASAP